MFHVLTQQNGKRSCCSCQQCKSSEASIGIFLEPTVKGKHIKLADLIFNPSVGISACHVLNVSGHDLLLFQFVPCLVYKVRTGCSVCRHESGSEACFFTWWAPQSREHRFALCHAVKGRKYFPQAIRLIQKWFNDLFNLSWSKRRKSACMHHQYN